VRESMGLEQAQRRNESEGRRHACRVGIPRPRGAGAPTTRPVLLAAWAECERTRWDPKDGELCPDRTRPEETLVEVRSGSDVQIDRQIRV
jgi:hypothetical protein